MPERTKNLEIHLVGGAVRDELMGIPIKDRDWVVVGTTPAEMIQRGFKPVGKDFPVFLHPETHEEYALARLERKTAPGYHGFEVISDPSVTLEQDLERRDLTINAIAKDKHGNYTDPHHGREDIQNKTLRHVSKAFAEDPVRILRVARFIARFADQDFKVADDTLALMQQMVAQGEADALVAERVWQEIHSALQLKGFPRFVETLRSCGALKVILPELDALYGVPQTEKYHPEIDTGIHIMLVLQAAIDNNASPIELFAAWLHDLGKALTPKNELPAHKGHEKSGLAPINVLCDRLRVPKDYRALALKVCEFHLHMHRFEQLKATTILKLLEKLDAFRKPETLDQFICCCQADKQGRGDGTPIEYPQGEQLQQYFQAANTVDTKAIAANQIDGQKIANDIRRARLDAIKAIKSQNRLT